MKHNVTNDTLIIYFEGQLNSFNAEQVEKDINEIINKEKFSKLVLDFDELKYISSAGLRIVMVLKQRYNDIVLTKVSDDINDIFTMVGFDTILTIERK